jgi:hypothetical protein
MRNATVRQILNCIVSQRRNGAWVVQQPPWNMDKDPPYGLWHVFEYDGNNEAKTERNCFRSGGLGPT